MKLNFISQPIYLVAICFLKLSIGFFLIRIAVKAFYKRLIVGMMGEFLHDLDVFGKVINLTKAKFL
jgi:hypothetical protein